MSRTLTLDGVTTTIRINSNVESYKKASQIGPSGITCCYCGFPLMWIVPAQPGDNIIGKCQKCKKDIDYTTIVLSKELAEYFDGIIGSPTSKNLGHGEVMHIVLPRIHPEFDTHINKFRTSNKEITSSTEGIRSAKSVHSNNSTNLTEVHDTNHFLQLGFQRFKQNDYDGAERAYKQSLQLDPKNYACNLALGDLYFAKEENKDAENNYRIALIAFPNDPGLLLRLGYICTKKGIRVSKSSDSHFETDSNNVRSLNITENGMNALLRGFAIFSEAQIFFRNSINAAPHLPDSYLFLSHLLLKINSYEEAEKLLRKSLSLNSNNAQVLFALGLTLKATKTGDGDFFINKASGLVPIYKTAYEKIKRNIYTNIPYEGSRDALVADACLTELLYGIN